MSQALKHIGDDGGISTEELLTELTRMMDSSMLMQNQIKELTDYCSLLRHNLHVACEKLLDLGYQKGCTEFADCNTINSPTNRNSIPRTLMTDFTPSENCSTPSKRSSAVFDENGCDIVAESIDIIRSVRSSQKFEELSASVGASGHKKADPILDGLQSSRLCFDAENSLLDDTAGLVLTVNETPRIHNGRIASMELAELKYELTAAKQRLNILVDELDASQFDAKKSKEMVGNLETSVLSLKVLLRAEKEKSSRLEEQLSTVTNVVRKQLSISSKQKG